MRSLLFVVALVVGLSFSQKVQAQCPGGICNLPGETVVSHQSFLFRGRLSEVRVVPLMERERVALPLLRGRIAEWQFKPFQRVRAIQWRPFRRLSQ